jgi:NAD-dependent dihydropyrimidine dehydrogenase PreA subunit
MTYIVTASCIDTKDKSCIDVCPVDCIYETERMMLIDPQECIDCGACEPVCPVDAIFPEVDLPEASTPFIAINAAINSAPEQVGPLLEASGHAG